MRTRMAIVFLCTMQLWVTQARAQDACEFRPVDTLDAEHGWIAGLNNWGQAIGSLFYGDPLYVQRPFIWHDGETRVLPALEEGASAGGMAINDVGRAVGWSASAQGTVPVTWFRNEVVALHSRGGGAATAINNRGQVGGYTFAGQCSFWPSIHSPPIILHGVGDGYCQVYAISERGVVVGEASIADGSVHAFVWENGETDDVNPSGARISRLEDVNRSNLATGAAFLDDGPHPLVRWPGGMRVLPQVGTGEAVNVWGSIAVLDFSIDRALSHLLLGDRFGNLRDMGTLGGYVFAGDLFMNDRFQLAWNPYPEGRQSGLLPPHVCQLNPNRAD